MTWHFVVNIIAALLLGSAIGIERQWRQHTAGLRTNALVSLGAALFVALSSMIEHESSPSRIAAQVVSGLGFIGGGVILREGLNVRGLNTAATLWCSGAVGSLAGAGFPVEATLGTLSVLAVHLGLRPLARRIDLHTKSAVDVETFYRLRIESEHGQEANLRQILLRHVNAASTLVLHGLSTDETNPSRPVIVADIYSTHRADRSMEEIVARVSIEPSVKSVSWQRAMA